jgi:hypothetical protein
MAFTANDGKAFTNRPPMMSHNKSMARAGQKSEAGGVGTKVDPLAQPQGEPDGDEQDGAAIAQAHGPAHEVHLQHHEEMGQHHVHSMHPDGHEHHSDHPSKEHAHEHGKKLAGIGIEPESEMGGEEPQYE